MKTLRSTCQMAAGWMVVGALASLLPVRAWAATSGVTVYPRFDVPGYVYTDATDYAVTANGSAVPVRDYHPYDDISQERDYYYAHFGLTGTITVEVDAREPIESFTISPINYRIKGEVSGTKLRFTLDRSRYLGIKINQKRMLYILADPDETKRPASSGVDPATGKQVFNIALPPYSADNTGKTLVSETIKKAIADAAKAPNGGGIVYVPAGVYMMRKIYLQNNVHVYLEPGAMLLASSDRAHWRQEKRGMKPDEMLVCYKVSNVRFYGRGVINAQGVALKKQKLPGIVSLRLKPFKIHKVKEFVIDGLIVNESTAWTIAPEGGERIAIVNTKVLNDKRSGTNDGIDLCGGTKVLVKHCFVATMDDAVCVKGLYYGENNEIKIVDIVTDSRIVGIKIGMQGAQTVRNVHVSDFNIISCHKGIDLMHDYGRSAYRDILFEDVHIENVYGGPAVRAIVRFNKKPMYPRGVGPIHDIEFRRIHIYNPPNTPVHIQGYDATNSVRNITFTDLYIKGEKVTGPGPSVKVGKFAQNVVIQGKVDPASAAVLVPPVAPAVPSP